MIIGELVGFKRKTNIIKITDSSKVKTIFNFKNKGFTHIVPNTSLRYLSTFVVQGINVQISFYFL